MYFSSYSSLNFYKKFKKIKKKLFIHQQKIKIQQEKSKKKFIVGTCSNISPIKNIIFLKIAETFKKHEDIEFKILGNYWDSQRNYFNKCLNFKKERKLKNVNFIINSNNSENYFQDMTLFMYKHQRSCPVSIIEAMEKKIPIISTDVEM